MVKGSQMVILEKQELSLFLNKKIKAYDLILDFIDGYCVILLSRMYPEITGKVIFTVDGKRITKKNVKKAFKDDIVYLDISRTPFGNTRQCYRHLAGNSIARKLVY